MAKENEVAKIDPNMIREIPLKDIIADFEWNCRRVAGEKEENTGGEAEENEFDALVNSIDQKGQITPVTVRPKGQKFFLVSGFRRFSAIAKLAEKNGEKNPVIKAVVKVMTDIEAREENMGENAARRQMDPTGLCKGLIDLKRLYAESKQNVSITALADRIGINRPYASALNTIAEKLKPELLKQWFDSPTAIGVNKVTDVARAPSEEQDKLWEQKAAVGGRGNKTGADSMDASISSAEKLGALLGLLEGSDLIDTGPLEFKRDLDKLAAIKLIKLPKEVTAVQKKDILHALEEAYNEALELARNPPEPEAKEEKPKKAKKAKAEAAAN